MTKSYQAIILAAGFGNRMRPLTDNNHKTLLEINGESVLSHIIIKLIKNNITDITLVLGYRAKEVSDHVEKRFPEINFNYVTNERYDKTNNLVSLSMALEAITLRSDVIIIESDLVYGDGVLKRILDSDYDNVALVDHFRTGMDGTVVSLSGDQIIGVIPPHLQSSDFSFKDKYKTLNIYKFSSEFCFGSFRELLTYYTTSIKDSYYELILGVCIYLRTQTIYAEVLQGEKWAEIDDPNDLQLAKFMFEDKPKKILDKAYGGFWNYGVTDFCYLRNMYFPPASLLSELKNNLDKTIYEYGSSQTILNRKMSYFLQCAEENVVAVNGISQLFPIIRHFLANKTVIHPNPTFGDYHRVFPKANHFDDKVGIDLKQIENCVEDAVVIVNPNNPTGTLISSDWIYNYAATHPQKTVIVDESFIDFSDEKSIIEKLKVAPLENMIIITSLSKCLGVAGLRIGYCYTHNKEFLATLKEEVPIWNMNTIAENFLEILLKYRPQYRQSLELVKRDRQEFSDILSDVSIVAEVFPSGGDYLLAKLTINEKQQEKMCDDFLADHNMYLKPVGEKFEDGQCWMRFAVHQPSQNRLVVKYLNEYAMANKLK